MLAFLLSFAGSPFLPAPAAQAATASNAAKPSNDQLGSVPDENAAAKAKAQAMAGPTGAAIDGADGPAKDGQPGDYGVVDYDKPGAPAPAPLKPSPNGPRDKVAAQKGVHELVQMRTEKSRTIQLPDGTLKTEFSSGPMNMKMPDGHFEPINPTLDQSPPPGGSPRANTASKAPASGRHVSRTSPSPVEVADVASDPNLAVVRLDADTSVGFGLRGAAAVHSSVNRNEARFDGVMANVDLDFEARASGLKETLVLHDASAPGEYVYSLNLQGLQPVLNPTTGDVELRDSSGKARARVPAGSVRDSAGQSNASSEPDARPVQYQLRGEPGRQELVMTVDRSWLSDPARVFPAFVDPQVINGDVSQDTYVSNCSVNANVDSESLLRVGGGPDFSGPGCNRYPLIQWNPNLPPGALVLGAEIALYNTHSWSCDLTETVVDRVLGAWDGGARFPPPNFDPNPVATAISGLGPAGGCDPGFVEFVDVNGATGMRDMVRAWVADPGSNQGVLVAPAPAFQNTAQSYKEYESSEGGADFGTGPLLQIVWSPWLATITNISALVLPNFAHRGVFQMHVTNFGLYPLLTSGFDTTRVTYFLADCAGNLIGGDRPRTALPRDVAPASPPDFDSVDLQVDIEPLAAGCYQILFDLQTDSGVSFLFEGSPLQFIQFQVVDEAPVVVSVAPAGQTNTNRPRLSAGAVSPDLWPFGIDLFYSFRICRDQAMTTDCQNSGATTSPTWDPTIKWETQHWWDVTVYEGDPGANPGALRGTRPPSPLTATVPQPRPRHFGADPQASDHAGVNLSIGNYSRSVTDMNVAGAGPALRVDRTYNSMNVASDGAFGVGWTAPWDARAKAEPATNSVLISFSDGHEERFGVNPDGSFSATVGRPDVLSGNANAGYVLTLADNTQNTFDASGRLSQITDLLGHALALAYDASGRLTTITNVVSHRVLHITQWTATTPARIQRIETDPVTDAQAGTTAPIVVTYAYANNRLTQVCGPRYGDASVPCTNYAYGTTGGSNGRLTKMTLPNGNDFVRIGYGLDGRVAWQEDGAGDHTTYADDRGKVEGLYHPLAGARVYDSDVSPGVIVPAGGAVAVPITGMGGVPTAGVQSVAVNITAVAPTASGYLQVYPSGATPGGTSSLQLAPGLTADQLHLVGVGADGKFMVRAASDATRIRVDVVGWFGKADVTGGSSYHPTGQPADDSDVDPPMPTRLLSTVPGFVVGDYSTPFSPGTPRTVQVTGRNAVPAGATAAVVNVTTTDASVTGSFTAWPTSAASAPATSSLQFSGPRSNQSIVQLGTDGAFNLRVDANASANVVIDVVGWFADATMYPDGSAFRPTVGTRIFDTRPGANIGPFDQPWGPGETRYLPLGGKDPINSPNASAIVGTITAIGPSSDTVLAAFPAYTNYTFTQAHRAPQGGVTSNAVVGYGMSRDGQIGVRNSAGTTNLLFDTYGWFERLNMDVTATTPRGNASHFVYDPQGRLVKHLDEYGDVRQMRYGATGTLDQMTDETGRTTSMRYDERGNVIARSTQDSASAPVRTMYMEYFFNPANVRDPRNNRMTAQRDARSTGEPDGLSSKDDRYKTTFVYNDDGSLRETRSPATADFPQGRAASSTYASGTEAAVGGGTVPRGLPLITVDRAGRSTRYDYLSNGDVARVTTPSGLRNDQTNDQLGRPTTMTEFSDSFPSGLVTTLGYDASGHTVSARTPTATDPVNARSHTMEKRTTYDANGNVTREQTSDAQGFDAARATTSTYDNADRPVDMVSSLGVLTHSVYDGDSNVTQLCEGGTTAAPCTGPARVTAFSYTARNELGTTKLMHFARDPIGAPTTTVDLQLEARSYDRAGRLAVAVNARGALVLYTYVEDKLLAKKVLKGFVNPDGTTRDVTLEENTFDAAGNLVTAKSDNGMRTATNTVDEAGRVTATVADPAGRNRMVATTYFADDQPKTVSVSEGGRTESTSYTYTPAGKPDTVSVANGATPLVTRYSYDQRGLQLSVTSPGGKVVNTTYDENGKAVTETLPTVTAETFGAAATSVRPVSTKGYNTFGELAATKDPLGNVTKLDYDLGGHPIQTTYPTYTTPLGNVINATSRQTYDAFGNEKTSVDRRGNTTTFDYDIRGQLVRQTDPPAVTGRAAGTTQYTYDDGGNLVQTKNPIGATALRVLDLRDRETETRQQERNPAPATGTQVYSWKKTYDDAGNVVTATDPTNVALTSTYDGLGARRTQTDPTGARTNFDYDVANRLVRQTDPEGRQAVNTFDLAGRPTQTQLLDPQNAVLSATGLTVDPDGMVTSVTDPRGVTSTRHYDGAGRLTSVDQPTGAATITRSFGYDAIGNPTRVTDGRGQPTWTTYNSWGLAQSVVEPSTAANSALAQRTWTTTYDVGGLPVSTQAPGAVTKSATFDALGLVRSVTGSGAEAATTTKTFDYDAAGRMTSFSRPGATTAVNYNDRGAVLSVADTSTTAYTYDAAGRLASRADPAGTAQFTYDQRGLLRTATDPLTGATGTYSYKPAGQLDNIAFGSGQATQAYTYDAVGRVATESFKNGTSVLSSSAYTYDQNSNVTSKTVTPAGVAGSGTQSYTYDQANRLASWTTPQNVTTNYTWDANNNRTAAGATTSAYDERNRLLSSTTAGVATTYAWSARGTLASKQTGTAAAVASTFDAFDREVSTGTNTNTYDALDRIRVSGTRTLQWSGLSNELASDGQSTYSMDASGRPIGSKTGSTASLLVTNVHGDVLGAAAPSGTAMVSSRSFDPWGKVTATVGSAGPQRGFQGDVTDPVTGRVDMNARQYDPEIGAFTARDSVTDPAMGNRYGYTAANPLSHTDPSGHWGLSDVGNFVGNVASSAGSFVNDHVIQPAYEHVIKPVASAARAVWDYGWDVGERVVSAVGNAIRSGWDLLAQGFNYVKNLASNAYNWGKQQVGRAVQAVARAGSAVIDRARTAVQRAATVAYERSTATVHAMQHELAQRAEQLKATVTRPIAALARSVQSVVQDVFKDAGRLVQLLPAAAADIASATKDFIQVQVIPAALNFASSATDAIGSRLGQAWDAMANDPWGTLAMVGIIAAGVALCFVAGPVGVGILIGAGLAAGMGVASGNFNPRSVAIGGAIGGLTAGIGSGASVGTTLAIGAGAGGGGNIAEQTIAQGRGLDNINWTGVAVSTGAGMAMAGAARGLSGSGATESTGSRWGGRMQGDAGAVGPSRINPSEVRFSQDSIKSTFQKGGSVDDLASGLRSGSVEAGSVEPIRLTSRDGNIYSIDNRRLYAFQQAEVDAPWRWATPGEVQAAEEAGKFSTQNEGTSIRVRGR